MSLIAAALIITSAFMHATWNFVSKRSYPSLAFFFLTAVSAALVMAPALYTYRHSVAHIATPVWILIVATGLAQAIYFFGLAGAYRAGDISLAYPLARALPVLFIAAISLLLRGGGAIGRWGLVGMVMITAGCIILPLPHFRRLRPGHYANIVTLMALVAAVGTTAYTLIDDQALRHLRSSPTVQLSTVEITLLFISLQTISTAVMLGLAAVLIKGEREQFRRLLNSRRVPVTALVTGVVIMATYGLVLAAMAYVTNVSYVAAFRQLSIPIGALLGLILAREPRFRPKLIGIGIVMIGLLLVGIG